MTYRAWVPQEQIRPTDRLLTDPLPEDPDELVQVERAESPPPPPPPAPEPVPAVDPGEFAAVRDLALAIADVQPPTGKAAAPIREAAEKVRRGGKP